jgi:hypothetical protein
MARKRSVQRPLLPCPRVVLKQVRILDQEVPARIACGNPPAIVPLPFTLAAKAPSIGLLVGNRYALDIPADFDEVTLTRLLSVLEPRC